MVNENRNDGLRSGTPGYPAPSTNIGEPTTLVPPSEGKAEPEISLPNTSTFPSLDPKVHRQYRDIVQNGVRATREDFVDRSDDEGSLWASSGQTNYFFTKNKIRSPGDIVTVSIQPELLQDISSEIKRTLTPKEKFIEVSLLRDSLQRRLISPSTPVNVATAAPTPQPSSSPATEATTSPSEPPTNAAANGSALLTPEQIKSEIETANIDRVDMTQSLDLKPGTSMIGEITDRFPNGNYKIRAIKRIHYNNGPPRLVSVLGIVKASDISDENDGINSGKLYEYRVEIAH